jgi:hypothetical protein
VMSKLLIATLVLVVSCLFGVRADETKPARDPFWPVGYKKPVPPPPVPVVDTQTKPNVITTVAEPPKPDPLLLERVAAELQDKIRERLKVNGFMKKAGQQAAIVNGEIRKVGDLLDIHIEGKTYLFKVMEISPRSVKVEPVD